MRKGLLLLLSLFLTAASLASSAFPAGVDAGSFIRDGVGARAFGLGGGFVAAVDDVSVPFWNPSALAVVPGLNVGGMYTDRYGQGIVLQSLGATFGQDRWGLGLSMARSSIDGIPFTGEHEGEFFSETQTVWLASLGYVLAGEAQTEGMALFSVGASFKYYTHTMLEGRASGFGLDVGLLARMPFPWGEVALGLSAKDVGDSLIHWTGTDHNPTNNVAWTNSLGASVSLFESVVRLDVQGDIAFGHSDLNRLHLGAELWPVTYLGARCGAVVSAAGEWRGALGASLQWKGLTLDYAYVPHAVLGASHVLSAQFGIAIPGGTPTQQTED